MRSRVACHIPDEDLILPDTIFADAAATRSVSLSRNGVTRGTRLCAEGHPTFKRIPLLGVSVSGGRPVVIAVVVCGSSSAFAKPAVYVGAHAGGIWVDVNVTDDVNDGVPPGPFGYSISGFIGSGTAGRGVPMKWRRRGRNDAGPIGVDDNRDHLRCRIRRCSTGVEQSSPTWG
jgi:hypothetical protein